MILTVETEFHAGRKVTFLGRLMIKLLAFSLSHEPESDKSVTLAL